MSYHNWEKLQVVKKLNKFQPVDNAIGIRNRYNKIIGIVHISLRNFVNIQICNWLTRFN